MDRVMPRESLSHQTRARPHHRLVAFGQLIFDDNMKRRMRRSVRQIDAFIKVKFLDENDPLLLIEREPLGGVRGLRWDVSFHGNDIVQSNGIFSRATNRGHSKLFPNIPSTN